MAALARPGIVEGAETVGGKGRRGAGDPEFLEQTVAELEVALAFEGEIAVDGTAHDFGPVQQSYWNRYIVPYGVFSIRVGYAGRDDLWSPLLTIKVRE